MKLKTSRASVRGDVFINCPFDTDYEPVFRALVFALLACRFNPRCALEIDDGGEVRLEKILRIMRSCRFSLHDISRTELDAANQLPRFNMPFELGLFLGLSRGTRAQKSLLILDSEPYRYQKFLSDIAGQDIRSHSNDPLKAMSHARNWLTSHLPATKLMGGAALGGLYQRFIHEVPLKLVHDKLEASEITFVDWTRMVKEWLARTNLSAKTSFTP